MKTIKKNYEVTLNLIMSYIDNDLNTPNLKQVSYFVYAESQGEAIRIAKNIDEDINNQMTGTYFSVYESWAEEIN